MIRRALHLILVPVVLVTVLGSLSACGTETNDTAQSEGTTFRYIIPAGTGDRIDAGEPVAIVPAQLKILVGDTVEIVNQDDRGHNVGPFFAAEGESVSQTFRSPGEYVDACSVHPSGEFTITVT